MQTPISILAAKKMYFSINKKKIKNKKNNKKVKKTNNSFNSNNICKNKLIMIQA